MLRPLFLFVSCLLLPLSALAQPATPSVILQIPTDDPFSQVNELLWSPDGTAVLAAYGDGVTVWDAATGDPRLTLEVSGRAWWGADAATVLTHDFLDREVTSWNLDTGESRYALPNTEPLDLVSPDGALMLTVAGAVVTVRDTATGEPQHTLEDFPLNWRWMGASQVVTTTQDAFQQWDLQTGALQDTFAFEWQPIDIQPNWMVTRQQAEDSARMRLYDMEQGLPVRQYRLQDNRVGQAVVSPDGDTLYVVSAQSDSDGDYVIVWNVEISRGIRLLVSQAEPHRVRVMRPSPDGSRLLTLSYPLDPETQQDVAASARLTLWDVTSGEVQARQQIPGMVDALWQDSGEQFLVWGLEGGALLNADSGDIVHTFDGPTQGAAFGPNGDQFATWGGQQIRLWNLNQR